MGSSTIAGARAIHAGCFALTLTLAVLAGAPASAQAQGQGQAALFNVAVPSFTDEQAARGKALYQSNCQMCHGADLAGGQFGPAVAGATFRAQWNGQSPGSLFSFISNNMPPTGPGSLSNAAYSDIDAYLLAANGVGGGSTELVAGQAPPPQAGRGRRGGLPLWGPPNYDARYKAAMAQQTALLDRMTPVTEQTLRDPPDSDWLMYRRTYSSLGYSPLKQINKSNVAELRAAWTWPLHVSPDEITPLVHDGILFIKSGDAIQALNGATGDLLWQYVRALPDTLNHGRAAVAKSMAIYQGQLYAPTADGHVIALDDRTGKVLWDHQILTPEETAQGVRVDGGPIVVKDKVIMGVSFSTPLKGGCFIFALDAHSGNEVWRFHTVARPGEPGGDSWNGAPVDQRYGGAVWTAGSYDPALNLIYFGTGNTYDTATLLMPQPYQGKSNDGLYTESTVALNPDTGKLVWYYQHMQRDVWDLDWVFEQSLINLPVDGRQKQLLVTGGKIAVFDALDRNDGKYEFSKDAGLQNVVVAIDPKTGHKTINPMLTPEAGKTKLLCPHGGGARSWPATSYDPATHILYVPLVESCADFTWIPRDAAQTAAGGMDMHFLLRPRPDSDGNFGRIEAINLQTRQIVWTDRQRAPIASAMLATAGGIAFNGARDRWFRAYDSATGKVLWKARLDAVPSSTPITYSIDGNEYVAVVAGGGGAHESTWPTLTPEINDPPEGTMLWIFRLPQPQSAADSASDSAAGR
jgi:alcohol dehydrogenase (cytochrome c)